jgi:hypothetical protein
MFESLMDQTWFQCVGATVVAANIITASLPDTLVQRIPILRTIWPILNWLAANIFNNINHPKGMKASLEVEKEIAEAKAKVAKRDGLPDTLAGL